MRVSPERACAHIKVTGSNQTGIVMKDYAEAVLSRLHSFFFCMPWHFIGLLVFRTVVSYIGKCTSS